MASLIVDGADLVVRLSGWERAAAFHGDIRVPLAAVRSVAVQPQAWGALRGIRAPGTGFPVELDPPSEFGRLLVSSVTPRQRFWRCERRETLKRPENLLR